jgi:hypothetical protein
LPPNSRVTFGGQLATSFASSRRSGTPPFGLIGQPFGRTTGDPPVGTERRFGGVGGGLQRSLIDISRRRRGSAAKIAYVEQAEVVLANSDRVTVRVGQVFLKIDADQARTKLEVEAMTIEPVPTPEILWRKPPVLALAAIPGKQLGRLEQPSTASPVAWAATGTAIRALHNAPLPPWPVKSVDELSSRLAGECEWLVVNEVLPADVVTVNRRLAEAALRP